MSETRNQGTVPAPAIGIHSRAMLVSLHVSVWAARKFDRKLTDKVNREHAASTDAGRYNKHLFGGGKEAESHAAVIGAASSARLVHYTQTLPWSDEGWRLLPSANFFEYTEAIRKTREKFETLVAAFIEEYPELQERARTLLNGLYREEDYPSVHEARRRFRISTDFAPIPDRGDFRVDLPKDQITTIEQGVNDRVREATELAMRDAWNRLFEIVARYRERMGDPDNIPKKSLVEGGRELVNLLARLNVTEDPALEAMRMRVGHELLVHEATDLREVEGLKEQTAAKAAEIMAAMQSVYGGGLGQ